MKKKILIPIIVFITIVIGIIILLNVNKKHKLEKYVKPEYNYFVMFSDEDKVGVIDKKGKLLIEPKYLDVFIPNPSKDVFICYENSEKFKILNSSGKELFKEYDDVTALQTSELNLDFEKKFLRFKKDDKYGLIDYDGNVIVSANYDELTSLKNKPGEILAKKKDKVGVLNSNGEIKIEIKYDSIIGDEYYNDETGYSKTGYIVGNKENSGFLYGYLNNYGEKVLNIKFESISRVLKYNDDNNSYLIVMSNGKKGVYKNSKKIIEQKYQNINYADSSEIFIVKRNSNYGVYNLNGKEILPVKYKAYSLAGDYISVENDELKELYDVNGNKISNLNYKSIQSSGNNGSYIAIDDNGFYSIITGDETISDNYVYLSYAFDNYFIFKNQDGYYGLIDIYNGIKIEPNVYNFMLKIDGVNAIQAVTSDGVVDIYSENIEKVISIQNAVLENVNENYTAVHSNLECYYIDKKGNIVENIKVFPNNKIFAFQENGKWGYKDKSGKVIIEPTYDFVTDTDEYGFSGIVLDGKWGVVDKNGEIVKQPQFTLETYYLPSFIGEYLLEIADTYHCLELN